MKKTAFSMICLAGVILVLALSAGKAGARQGKNYCGNPSPFPFGRIRTAAARTVVQRPSLFP